MQYQEIVSVQSQLVSFIQEKRYTMKHWFIIVWKDVFLLHVFNKNENIINAGYWVQSVLSENCKN